MLLKKEYEKHIVNKMKKILNFLLFLFIISLICLVLGTDKSIFGALNAVFCFVIGIPFPDETVIDDKIIVYLRLPRICLAILTGFGLAVSGVMMQSVTRNFLVSPFTLGVSSAAAFGASLCIVFGSATVMFNDIYIISSAFFASMVSIIIVFLVSKKIGITANSIVLVGIALNYFFGAMTAALQFFAQENKLAAVVQWTFGTFNKANWEAVIVIFFIVLLTCLYSPNLYLKWDAMATGDDEHIKSLGVNPEILRAKTMFLAILLTATIISFTGVIGFIGLIAPHMGRFIVGNNHKFLFPVTGLIGALLLLIADTIGRFILYPVNVPVGIVVSFLGVPLFINLIINSRKSEL